MFEIPRTASSQIFYHQLSQDIYLANAKGGGTSWRIKCAHQPCLLSHSEVGIAGNARGAPAGGHEWLLYQAQRNRFTGLQDVNRQHYDSLNMEGHHRQPIAS